MPTMLYRLALQPRFLVSVCSSTAVVFLFATIATTTTAQNVLRINLAEECGPPPSYFAPKANPILSDEPMLADPHVLEHDNTLYLYPTSNEIDFVVYTKNLLNNNHPWKKHEAPVFTPSSKLLSWCPLKHVPGAGKGNLAWAPHVFRDDNDDMFYLYYTACLSVGVAVSDSPLGPFEDRGLLCWFCIDAFVWRDPKYPYHLYFYYSRLFASFFHSVSSLFGVLGRSEGEEGGNINRHHALAIYGTRMVSPTRISKSLLVSFFGGLFSHVRIAYPSAEWEFRTSKDDDDEDDENCSSSSSWWSALSSYFNDFSFFLPSGVNEGAWVMYNNTRDEYILTYSGSSANSRSYRLGFATAKHPLGPFRKSSSNPIIAPSDPSGEIGIHGPGHHAIWEDPRTGKVWAFYHAKHEPTLGWERYISVDELIIDGACHSDAHDEYGDGGAATCEELSMTLPVTRGKRSGQRENVCV